MSSKIYKLLQFLEIFWRVKKLKSIASSCSQSCYHKVILRNLKHKIWNKYMMNKFKLLILIVLNIVHNQFFELIVWVITEKEIKLVLEDCFPVGLCINPVNMKKFLVFIFVFKAQVAQHFLLFFIIVTANQPNIFISSYHKFYLTCRCNLTWLCLQ